MVYYVCNGFDCAVPEQSKSIGRSDFSTLALGETNILKLPPTKNWRPMIAIEIYPNLLR